MAAFAEIGDAVVMISLPRMSMVNSQNLFCVGKSLQQLELIVTNVSVVVSQFTEVCDFSSALDQRDSLRHNLSYSAPSFVALIVTKELLYKGTAAFPLLGCSSGKVSRQGHDCFALFRTSA
jgi:hypothetical protein